MYSPFFITCSVIFTLILIYLVVLSPSVLENMVSCSIAYLLCSLQPFLFFYLLFFFYLFALVTFPTILYYVSKLIWLDILVQINIY